VGPGGGAWDDKDARRRQAESECEEGGLKLGQTWARAAAAMAPPPRKRTPENAPSRERAATAAAASERRKALQEMPSRVWAGRGVGWQRAASKSSKRTLGAGR
jgi:hypothetical protein